MSNKDRSLAILAEKVERYEDMVKAVRNMAESNVDLSREDRILFATAYKNIISNSRASWRQLSSIEKNGTEPDEKEVVKEYRLSIQKEITDICIEVIGLLDANLIPSSQSGESKNAYLKLKGDYYRYLCEISDGNALKTFMELSEKFYETSTMGCLELSETNPTRLGLALSFSVFYYEIKKHPQKAILIAQNSLEGAIQKISQHTDESTLAETTLLIQLLRDNLNLWICKNNNGFYTEIKKNIEFGKSLNTTDRQRVTNIETDHDGDNQSRFNYVQSILMYYFYAALSEIINVTSREPMNNN
ncbi:hypothetical protein PPL_06366 [Heterostelium album PN500]|uniref:14-3-3 domain-containing protein n=1 Tax=Heterostelium pallidum (strain ATCC 26659 / Pp 5 / PN500) TaxID=670386 RepID=D3BCY8_HETP5|nr:hypothetical protein PPL_06366 [Heterostelium album PN500]EFA80780.1 hypothetical protein PPL_06366 [Heterostelium album PN500]|eukprot:XP_020432899.1 hypothetical protein PPL_06366 [Heterostelium album PN500]